MVLAPTDLMTGRLEAFRKVLRADTKTAHIVVDMSASSYVDSAALGTLFSVSKLLYVNGRKLGLVGVNRDLRSLLHLTKLDRSFFVADKLDDESVGALREFAPLFSDDTDHEDGPPLRLI
jgi:anti-anti-sigma factor